MCNWMCVGMSILGGGGVCSRVALVGLMAGSVVELGKWLRAPAAASHFCHLRALLGERNPMKNTSNRVLHGDFTWRAQVGAGPNCPDFYQ
jgi:hypothetical protein